MSYNIKRIVVITTMLLSSIIIFLPTTCSGETLRFVFMADSRGDSLSDLIDTDVLNAINAKILSLSPRPTFVIFGGDMAYRGYCNDSYNFQAFKDAMKSLTDAGIKLYTVLGNHELYKEGTTGFSLANQQEFQKVFTDNPANGPAGYERLVYSFESPAGEAFFAALDCYYLAADDPNPGLNQEGDTSLYGYIDDTQRTWLANQVAKTKAIHKFVFTHAPYYQVNSPQSDQNTSYTELWKVLDDNRFDVYFCGHVHLFSRKTICSNLAPNPQISPAVTWKHNVTQVITGTCGAPVDTSPINPDINREEWHIFNQPNTYYFSVVDIDGQNKARITSYKGSTADYQPFDSFVAGGSSAPIGSYLLLLGN